MSSNNKNGIVWNSDQGWVNGASAGTSPKKSKKSQPKKTDTGFPNDGVTRVRREKGGRGGKTVTVLYGLPGSSDESTQLFKELKKLCGCGGTFKQGRIEIQGDHRDKILQILRDKNIVAKAAGG